MLAVISPAEYEWAAFPLEDPHTTLERSYMDQHLREHGYSRADLDRLHPDERLRLLVGASIYASGRLAEAETRAALLHCLRGGF